VTDFQSDQHRFRGDLVLALGLNGVKVSHSHELADGSIQLTFPPEGAVTAIGILTGSLMADDPEPPDFVMSPKPQALLDVLRDDEDGTR
jgi:hypothetical protein